MAGDLGIREWVSVEGGRQQAAAVEQPQGRVIHRYGRINIHVDGAEGFAELPHDLTQTERFGLAGLQLRESEDYQAAKRSRPRAAAPTSFHLEGTVAVGVVIVEGPTAALQFADAERTKVVAEVQNGLGRLATATANPVAGISFAYDIQDVTLPVPADPDADDLEAHWRNPAMSAIGFSADWNGVTAYVEHLRSRFGTRWTYCGFFTKYPVCHFAYASIGGLRVVMQYANDGWGPDNIDRVFAHETGRIFGCPDEYASSGRGVVGAWLQPIVSTTLPRP